MSEDTRIDGEAAKAAEQAAESAPGHARLAEPDERKRDLAGEPGALALRAEEWPEPGTGRVEQGLGLEPPGFVSNGEPVGGTMWLGFPPVPPALPQRTPNFLDAMLFVILLIAGVVVSSGLLGAALYFHWLDRSMGIHGLDAAAKSTPVALGLQFLIYVIALGVAVPVFSVLWHKSFFAGLHWHGSTAFRFRYVLFGVAVVCNVLAIVGNLLIPFPKHAPIDKLFSTTADAWMLACFGIAIAPFFEEMIFRGFLLPAVATAWDWCLERMRHESPRPLDEQGNPVWSPGAMVFAALLVSAPFAAMHAAQVGNAWGPVTLLYCVSLILCAVRLKTRSLAASTLVHASYNFLLFAVMFAETSGFRHMDKL